MFNRRKNSVTMGRAGPVIHDVNHKRKLELDADFLNERHHAIAAEDGVQHMGL